MSWFDETIMARKGVAKGKALESRTITEAEQGSYPYIYTAQLEPVLRVDPGTVVAAETHDAVEGAIKLARYHTGRPYFIGFMGGFHGRTLGSLGFTLFRPATPDEIVPVMGAKPGSLGAVKGTIKDASALAGIFADQAIRLTGNGTTGANTDGFHLRNVNVTRDLAITKFGDFRRVVAGEPCPKSGHPLKSRRGIEVGHIFKLGTKYSDKYGAVYTDDRYRLSPVYLKRNVFKRVFLCARIAESYVAKLKAFKFACLYISVLYARLKVEKVLEILKIQSHLRHFIERLRNIERCLPDS